MRTWRTTLTAILALLAALTIAVPATASIPQPSPELGSIEFDRAELLSLLEPAEIDPGVADPPCIAERHDLFGTPALETNRLSLRPVLDRALRVEAIALTLPETRVGDIEKIELVPHQDELTLTRALRQGYAALAPDIALGDQYQDSSNLYAFAGGDPVNNSDPTGECIFGWGGTCAEWANAGKRKLDSAKLWVDERTSAGVVGITVNATVGTLLDATDTFILDPLRVGDATGEAIGSDAGALDMTLAVVQDVGRGAAVAAGTGTLIRTGGRVVRSTATAVRTGTSRVVNAYNRSILSSEAGAVGPGVRNTPRASRRSAVRVDEGTQTWVMPNGRVVTDEAEYVWRMRHRQRSMSRSRAGQPAHTPAEVRNVGFSPSNTLLTEGPRNFVPEAIEDLVGLPHLLEIKTSGYYTASFSNNIYPAVIYAGRNGMPFTLRIHSSVRLSKPLDRLIRKVQGRFGGEIIVFP